MTWWNQRRENPEQYTSFHSQRLRNRSNRSLDCREYYRWFIPSYATIAASLTNMTRKTEPEKIIWTPQCISAFNKLKEILLSTPIMMNPDFSRPFILQTDASEVGIGAILSQTDTEGYDHPLAYFSRKLLPREQKFATIEKDCLAIKLGMEAFWVYLLGKSLLFKQTTGHWSDRDNNNRLMWWSLSMQPFCFQVQHRKGIDNANADALSWQVELDGQLEPREGGGVWKNGRLQKGRLHHNDLIWTELLIMFTVEIIKYRL